MGFARRVAAIGAVLAGLAVVSGCGSGDDGPSGSPDPVPTGTLTEVPCPDPIARPDGDQPELRITCHDLVVPLAAGSDGLELTHLAVVVLHTSAATPEPDPVVVVHGGPGGSLTGSAGAWLHPPAPVLESRDVVLVDQRGGGRSLPSLDCPEVDAADTAGAEADALGECHDRLVAAGIPLDAFTVADSARDLVALRRALGVDAWNIDAVSYGTRVALTTLALDPSGVRSVVLDSTYPPDVDVGSEQAVIGADAIRDLLRTAGRGDLVDPLDATLEELAASPVSVTWTPVGGGEAETIAVDDRVLAGRLLRAQYASDRLGAVVDAVAAAVDDRLAEALAALDESSTGTDSSVALSIAASERHRTGAPVDGEGAGGDGFSEGAYWIGECREGAGRSIGSAPPPSGDPLVRALEADVDELRSLCSIWDLPPVPTGRIERTEAPVLLVGGELDPVTPLRWARSTAGALGPTATVLPVPRAGHGPSLTLGCVEDVVAIFIADPSSAAGLTLPDDCPPPP